LKVVFIEAASEVLKSNAQTITESRLSIMTGIHRRDVKRLMNEDFKFDHFQDLVTKVIGLWQTSPQFTESARNASERADVSKDAKTLSYGSENSLFADLVASVSQDLNPATVLFELERVGMVEKTSSGIRLVQDTYTPCKSMEEYFALAERDVKHLIAAVESNALRANEYDTTPDLHARTEFDRIRPEALEKIREWLVKEGHKLHARARVYLASYDQDFSPDPSFSGSGARVVLGTFGKVYAPGEDDEAA
jgi:hypothetical protein